jgi:hypothetical protein
MHPIVIADGIKKTAVQERYFAVKTAVVTIVMAPVIT